MDEIEPHLISAMNGTQLHGSPKDKILEMLREARSNLNEMPLNAQSRAIKSVVDDTEVATAALDGHRVIVSQCQAEWALRPGREPPTPLSMQIECSVRDTGALTVIWTPSLNSYSERRTFQSLLAFNHGPKANIIEIQAFNEVRLSLQRMSLHRRMEDTFPIMASRCALWACSLLPQLLLDAIQDVGTANVMRTVSIGYDGQIDYLDPQLEHREELLKSLSALQEDGGIPVSLLLAGARAQTSIMEIQAACRKRQGTTPGAATIQSDIHRIKAILRYNSCPTRRHPEIAL